MYDSYISLGDNCEIGLQFRRIGYEHSSFFRFTASPFKSTYQIIENDFQNIFLKENLVPRVCRDRETVMVRDTKYDIGIHAAMPYVKTEKGKNLFIQNEAFNAAYDREYSKVRYLIEKWNSLVKSDQNVLYLINDLLLRGWVVGKNLPVVSIELIDEEKEQVIKAIPVDRYRPAVAKQFENITNAATAGFATELSDVLMALESYPSSYKILLQIVLSDRTKVSMETLEFVKV
jgi:Putative papain-like cysteine peptidase (DUF1796)